MNARHLLSDRVAAVDARDSLVLAMFNVGDLLAPADYGVLTRLLHEAECICHDANLLAVDMMQTAERRSMDAKR